MHIYNDEELGRRSNYIEDPKIAKESQREASKKDPKSVKENKRELPKVHAQGRIYILM